VNMGWAANWNWALDGWIVAAGVLCAVAAALLGNFLVLRKMSMLGDAISHGVLPGLAAAFFLTGSRSSLPMFLGAVLFGVLTALFTQWIRDFGRVDQGAAMGVTFTTLFALGLVMIVRAADHVDLDPGCVLYGAIELTPLDHWMLAGWSMPRVVVVLSVVLLVNVAFVLLLYKELKLCSFDPALATVSGFHAGMIHYLLMSLVAVTAVASFESVGNILVVAMFIVPPATAYLLTDRLSRMIALSAVLAALAAVLGHIGAMAVPAWFGYRSTTTSGMMALAAGTLFLLAALLAPRHGLLARLLRRRQLAWNVLAEDLIALMYRLDERQPGLAVSRQRLQKTLLCGALAARLVLGWHRLRGFVRGGEAGYRLTDRGRDCGRALVRSHRLWEQYLASEARVPMDRLHDEAEHLEHFTGDELRRRLGRETNAPRVDPHGTPIPPER
jgi:manganese/zinc/iron transport system permease protein